MTKLIKLVIIDHTRAHKTQPKVIEAGLVRDEEVGVGEGTHGATQLMRGRMGRQKGFEWKTRRRCALVCITAAIHS